MAGLKGIEPSSTGRQPIVLPLNDKPTLFNCGSSRQSCTGPEGYEPSVRYYTTLLFVVWFGPVGPLEVLLVRAALMEPTGFAYLP